MSIRKRRTLNRAAAKGHHLRGQAGMTLLEIMIVLAIIALVMGFLIGPKVIKAFSKSEREIARMEAQEFACTAYTQFRSEKRKACPSDLSELLEYMNKKDTKDPWGNEYEMLCGDNKPAEAKMCIGVRSNGPDGQANSSDDVNSWD
ncbi:MAG TPA: prepilin-type N-terminal cleavage/methylation domain-containing protein [Kofleriaceae bacterium]|nr:prepilin-type N-terminal cleavage/methylation domain-containing protein [Kofleriaceae bacterium]